MLWIWFCLPLPPGTDGLHRFGLSGLTDICHFDGCRIFPALASTCRPPPCLALWLWPIPSRASIALVGTPFALIFQYCLLCLSRGSLRDFLKRLSSMSPRPSRFPIYQALALLLTLALPAWGQEASLAPNQVTWRGEVVLEADYLVPLGTTLTVEPGTRVRPLRPEFRILVQGVLRVLGTAKAPVVFAAPTGWGGVEFLAGPDGSRIDHAHFSKARTALSSAETAFALRHSTFRDCDTALKLLRKSGPQVTDCLFEGNGIAIDNEMRSSPQIRNNRFVGQHKAAILASHNSVGVIDGNVFEKNHQAISLLRLYDDRIVNNRFLNNATAISCNQTQGTPVIAGNHFENNTMAVESFSFSSPLVKNNTFSGNETAIHNRQLGSPRVQNNLFAGNGIALSNMRKSSPAVEKNLLTNNRVAVFCDYSSYPRIKQNNFLGNRIAVQLGDFQSAELEHRTGNQAVAQQAALLAQAGQNAPSLGPKLAGPEAVVDVSRNWWGEDTANLVAVGQDGNAAIFFDRHDQGDNQQSRPVKEHYDLDRVVFSPWLKTAVTDAGLR